MNADKEIVTSPSPHLLHILHLWTPPKNHIAISSILAYFRESIH
jgi:hypothetical protein